MTGGENGHERVEGLLELGSEGWGSFSRVRAQLELAEKEIAEELALGFLQELHQVLTEGVTILLQEICRQSINASSSESSSLTLAIVSDTAGEVSNAEADDVLGLSRKEVLVPRMVGVEFIAQRPVCSFGESTLFVDQGDDVHRLHGNQIENPLIIFEGDVLPLDVFVVVFFLFEFEDMMNEELLEILIGIVDAQLFEAIPLEVLEPEDIQDAETEERERELFGV